MKFDTFRTQLMDRKLDTKIIDNSIELLKEFDQFLNKRNKTIENLEYDDVHEYSANLISNHKNSYDNYLTLARYGYFINNEPLILASLELLDGGEVMENFSSRLEEEFGEEIRKKIFGNLDVPPLGLKSHTKPAFTKQVITKFLEVVGEKKCEEFLAQGLRNKYVESYKNDREMFLNSSNIDDFLEKKGQKFIQTLTRHKNENSLFFTQRIDDVVLEYVKNNPEIESGVRKGSKILLTKIPYMAQQYLAATTDTEKRYYYCHCPWVREALKNDPQPVPPIFCNCSGGFYKNYWEAVLNQPVKVELLESVLTGASECKFALHIPEQILPAKD